MFPSKKRRINLSFRKRVGEARRVIAGDHHIHVRQFVAQDLEGLRHPRQFVPGQKAHYKAWLRGVGDASGCFTRGFHLGQHQTCVIQKGSARGSQFDSMSAARQQLGADLDFQIPDLAAKGRLRCM